MLPVSVCASIFIWIKGAEGGHEGPCICRLSLQPKKAAGNFADWLSINQRGKNESIGALLFGLKSGKLPTLQGRRLFSLPNWRSLLEKKVELTEKNSSGCLFTGWRFGNVLAKRCCWPERLKHCLPFFSRHAGSVPTHYNKHCVEQLFQLSTCPVFSLEGGPSTKTAADYAPHSTYVPINCVLGSNYHSHCSALRSSCEEVRHVGLHIFTWKAVIWVEVNFPSRFIALRNNPAQYKTFGWKNSHTHSSVDASWVKVIWSLNPNR